MRLIETATAYLRAGLCVLPAILEEKRPALRGWKQYQRRLPTERQVRAWFAEATPACILAGAVSGHLEMIDFDHGGELFDRWVDLVATEAPGLVERLVIERSQSGGRHGIYRCAQAVPGNRKLAQRTIVVPSADPVTIAGKRYVPRRVGDQYEVTCTLLETRGEGGLFLCDPTPGYQLEQGSFDAIPVLDGVERAILIEAACALNETVPPAASAPTAATPAGRPGDDFNEHGDVREVLRRHGWSLVRSGDNEYWRRPGKDRGWSATLKDGLLYVFSSNASPFEPDRAYAPFTVYTLLDHGGDFAAAAAALRVQGFGSDPVPEAEVNLSGLLAQMRPVAAEPPARVPEDPGPLPDELLRVPGFVSEVMDYCLQTAPYPNQVMAFSGALALQAFLAGRKVRDPGDNRTNLYLLGLAHSAAGKDWPRKVNTRILHEVGLADCLGERFASGEGIQDALFISPSMLFQTDEIDGLLQSINKARDARHENIMSTLLTLYSSANSVFPMRRKAGKESPGAINQPSLVIFGTAIPNHYYEALSERMLTNGFFARMIILECGRRGSGQEPQIRDLPDRVLETAAWWNDFRPGTGNLSDWHPVPLVVPQSVDAQQILAAARVESETEYEKAEAESDAVGTTVWGRLSEQSRKLALLYAISANAQSPEIGRNAAEWAVRFAMHQTRRMLYMAAMHVSDTDFEQRCNRVLAYMKDRGLGGDGEWIPYRDIIRRFRWSRHDHEDVRNALADQEHIEVNVVGTKGRSRLVYRLRGES